MISNWRKSVRSAENATCVEVGWTEDVVGYRDTKQAGQGSVLLFGKPAAARFASMIKTVDVKTAEVETAEAQD